MKFGNLIVITCVALGLLVAAGLISIFKLWGLLGNLTVPWFCSSLAIAILLVAMTSALTDCPPATIPISRVLAAIVGTSVAVGVGMLVDAYSYSVPTDLVGSLAEWAGFTTMVVVVFWIPRESNRKTTC
jgi:hypothetical protein